MKEALRNVYWKNNAIWAAVMAVVTFIYYIIMDVVEYKHSITKEEW